MIEKIFIVFVIMEACGLILHILDSIRCWTDRIYYRKQQSNANDFNQKMYESKKREEENLKNYMLSLGAMQDTMNSYNIRLRELENNSNKKPTKKTKETK